MLVKTEFILVRGGKGVVTVVGVGVVVLLLVLFRRLVEDGAVVVEVGVDDEAVVDDEGEAFVVDGVAVVVEVLWLV